MEVLRIWVKNLERKEDIRRRILTLRSQLSETEREQKTAAITEKIIHCRYFQEAERIFCYIDFQGEAGTRRIIEEAWRLGKEVYAPRVSGDTMDFFEFDSYSELIPGTFGILEPSGREAAETSQKRLMILPGVAFDKSRNRIGYGGGYYDKYLAVHPEIQTIGIAFELQLVECIEAENTDVKVKMIVTEKGMYE